MSMAHSAGFPVPSRAASESVSARQRISAVIDISVAYGLILATIWAPKPVQQWIYLVAAAWIIFSTWRSFPGWNALGFRLGGFWSSAWVMGAGIAIFSVAVAIAVRIHTLREPITARGWVMAFGGYTVWSFAQQFLLQSYFLYRFRKLIGNPRLAALAAAGIFAAAHLPNPILAPVTLLWGLCACFVFLRHRNLYPLAITHALLGICVAVTIPGPVVHNMRVGLGYLRYHPHAYHAAPAAASASIFTRIRDLWPK